MRSGSPQRPPSGLLTAALPAAMTRVSAREGALRNHSYRPERRRPAYVRDFHPIPLFSEQACVSDCSGRAFATKAMLFSCLQDLSLTDALRSFYI